MSAASARSSRASGLTAGSCQTRLRRPVSSHRPLIPLLEADPELGEGLAPADLVLVEGDPVRLEQVANVIDSVENIYNG